MGKPRKKRYKPSGMNYTLKDSPSKKHRYYPYYDMLHGYEELDHPYVTLMEYVEGVHESYGNKMVDRMQELARGVQEAYKKKDIEEVLNYRGYFQLLKDRRRMFFKTSPDNFIDPSHIQQLLYACDHLARILKWEMIKKGFHVVDGEWDGDDFTRTTKEEQILVIQRGGEVNEYISRFV